MSASLLLGYICAVLLGQLGIAIAIAARARRQRERIVPSAVPGAASRGGSGAWQGFRELRVVRREFEDGARTQCSFYLEPVDGVALPPFTPGQFLTFALEVTQTHADASRGLHTLTRCYSLSDKPEPGSYRITVKRVLAPEPQPQLPPGVCSSHLHDHVAVGDTLRVRAPAGHFALDPDPSIPSVLIAGGIGITPLFSMLRGALCVQPNRALHLYYGVRRGAERAFRAELEQLLRAHPSLQVTVVYSRPDPEDVQGRDFQHVGHIDVDLLRRTLPIGRHRFYVCGPPPLMASILPALRAWGVQPDDIHHEAFGPASARSTQSRSQPQAASFAPAFEIMFRRSGRTLAWDGKDESLLDFAERHDVAIDSGCRSGSCGSCEVRLLSGAVRYADPPDHEIRPGHCLLCVGVPESALELDA